jgi:hypothetical protein
MPCVRAGDPGDDRSSSCCRAPKGYRIPTASKAAAIAASFCSRSAARSRRNNVRAARSTARRLSVNPEVRDRYWVSAR